MDDNLDTLFRIQPRPELLFFAKALEVQMRYNEARGKAYGWVVFKPGVLFSRLQKEVGELEDELIKPDFDEPEFQHEALDVSTFGFFLWYQSKIREANK